MQNIFLNTNTLIYFNHKYLDTFTGTVLNIVSFLLPILGRLHIILVIYDS